MYFFTIHAFFGPCSLGCVLVALTEHHTHALRDGVKKGREKGRGERVAAPLFPLASPPKRATKQKHRCGGFVVGSQPRRPFFFLSPLSLTHCSDRRGSAHPCAFLGEGRERGDKGCDRPRDPRGPAPRERPRRSGRKKQCSRKRSQAIAKIRARRSFFSPRRSSHARCVEDTHLKPTTLSP